MSAADPYVVALVELRRARRRTRMANIHWVDALYHVYLAAVFGTVGIIVLAGLVGGARLDAHGIDTVRRHGAAVLGLLPAAALFVGLRSGSRGGPLALEAPDVRHVLLSPVDRGYALRGPAWRQLRFLTFAGGVTGGVAGLFAYHRVGHNPVALVVCGTGFGVATVMLGVGSALVAAGRHVPRWAATLTGFVVVAWSCADVAGKGPTAPATFLGRVPLWPLWFDAWGVVPLVLAVVLIVAGITGIQGLSIEHAERRTRLVGQLRFAVTLQDLRTVLVLRRQLALELPRDRPWFGGGRTGHGRSTVWTRGWRGLARWPATRLVRVVVLAVVAGLAARAVWNGVYPMAVVVGLVLWVAALDAIEPLAQETDHPSRRDGYPFPVGELMVRHLAVPAIVMVAVALVSMAAFLLAGPSTDALEVGLVSVVPLALMGAAGAVVSTLMGAPSGGSAELSAMLPPEFAGMKNAVRAAWPPALAVLGVAPLVAARLAIEHGSPLLRAALLATAGSLVAAALAAAWVRYREDIHEWWRVSKEEAMAAQSARTAQRGRDEDDEEDE